MVDTLNAKYQKLYRYSTQYKSKTKLSDRIIDKAADAFSHGGSYGDYSIRAAIEAIRVTVYGIAAIAVDSVESRKKRNTLCQMLGCTESELALDINELVDHKDRAKYYGGDFTYSAATHKGWLKNLTMIFGDAHLEALDEMSCLASLESVWGNIYFSRCTDLSGLLLKHVGGDFHGEKLACAKGLEQLEFIGGLIYYQNHRFRTLDEFKSFLCV